MARQPSMVLVAGGEDPEAVVLAVAAMVGPAHLPRHPLHPGVAHLVGNLLAVLDRLLPALLLRNLVALGAALGPAPLAGQDGAGGYRHLGAGLARPGGALPHWHSLAALALPLEALVEGNLEALLVGHVLALPLRHILAVGGGLGVAHLLLLVGFLNLRGAL